MKTVALLMATAALVCLPGRSFAQNNDQFANAIPLFGPVVSTTGNTWSRVQFNAIGGTVYRIVVDGNGPLRFPPNPARGNIRLNIKGVGGVEVHSPTNGAVFTFGDPIPVEVAITPDFPNPPAGRV